MAPYDTNPNPAQLDLFDPFHIGMNHLDFLIPVLVPLL